MSSEAAQVAAAAAAATIEDGGDGGGTRRNQQQQQRFAIVSDGPQDKVRSPSRISSSAAVEVVAMSASASLSKSGISQQITTASTGDNYARGAHNGGGDRCGGPCAATGGFGNVGGPTKSPTVLWENTESDGGWTAGRSTTTINDRDAIFSRMGGSSTSLDMQQQHASSSGSLRQPPREESRGAVEGTTAGVGKKVVAVATDSSAPVSVAANYSSQRQNNFVVGAGANNGSRAVMPGTRTLSGGGRRYSRHMNEVETPERGPTSAADLRIVENDANGNDGSQSKNMRRNLNTRGVVVGDRNSAVKDWVEPAGRTSPTTTLEVTVVKNRSATAVQVGSRREAHRNDSHGSNSSSMDEGTGGATSRDDDGVAMTNCDDGDNASRTAAARSKVLGLMGRVDTNNNDDDSIITQWIEREKMQNDADGDVKATNNNSGSQLLVAAGTIVDTTAVKTIGSKHLSRLTSTTNEKKHQLTVVEAEGGTADCDEVVGDREPLTPNKTARGGWAFATAAPLPFDNRPNADGVRAGGGVAGVPGGQWFGDGFSSDDEDDDIDDDDHKFGNFTQRRSDSLALVTMARSVKNAPGSINTTHHANNYHSSKRDDEATNGQVLVGGAPLIAATASTVLQPPLVTSDAREISIFSSPASFSGDKDFGGALKLTKIRSVVERDNDGAVDAKVVAVKPSGSVHAAAVASTTTTVVSAVQPAIQPETRGEQRSMNRESGGKETQRAPAARDKQAPNMAGNGRQERGGEGSGGGDEVEVLGTETDSSVVWDFDAWDDENDG